MKTILSSKTSHAARTVRSLGLAAALFGSALLSAKVPAVLDDFEDASLTTLGTMRLTITDAEIGGQSQVAPTFVDGVLRMEGKIVPARGQPGFVSLVMLLSPQGEPQDLGDYEGIRLRVRVTKGGLSVLAASSEIENFDFHATAIARTRGDFQELRIPFGDLKRVWSEQTPLNLATITSVNLVASGIQPGDFAYEIDEVGFY